MSPRTVSRGFTLIELLVVLTLMAFVAATVVVKLSQRVSSASLSQAVTLWEFTDSQLRQQARRKGRAMLLKVTVGANQIEFSNGADSAEKTTVRLLGRGVSIKRYLSATRDVTYGPLEIEYTDRGATETFAVEIEGRNGNRWILTSGITGQTSGLSNEQEVDAIMSKLLPSGIHPG